MKALLSLLLILMWASHGYANPASVGEGAVPGGLGDGDYGDWSCTTGTCTLDIDTIAAAEMANADHGAVSWTAGVATVEDVACTGCVDDADVDNNITIDLATAASALNADPSDCGSNEFAQSIVASGNLTCAAIADADVPDTITIDLATAASALNANPSDCAANTFANAIVANGNLTCATVDDLGCTDCVEPADLGDDDFGDFTCSAGDTCTLDTDSVSDNEIDYTTVTCAKITTTDCGAITTSGLTLGDDQSITLGGASDWTVNFDDSMDDQLIWLSAATTAGATTDPLYEVIVGTSPTADQQVWGVAKGTQGSNTALATLDEDGDFAVNASIASGVTSTPAIDFDDDDDTGTIEGSINVNCPTTNDCDMIFAVNSGADSETEWLKADTTDAGATTVAITGDTTVTGKLLGSTVGVGIGADPASTCTAGEIYIDTNTASDTNCTTTSNNSLCLCTATDTWVELDNN